MFNALQCLTHWLSVNATVVHHQQPTTFAQLSQIEAIAIIAHSAVDQLVVEACDCIFSHFLAKMFNESSRLLHRFPWQQYRQAPSTATYEKLLSVGIHIEAPV